MALAACTTPQSLLLSLLPDGTFLVPLSKLLGTENRNRERLLDLEERGDWAAVVATADAELQKNTQSAEWHYIRGMGEARRGNWRSAQGSFAHSVRLDPNELEGWYMLARAQVSSGERENAVRTLERALDVDRANPLTYFFLGETYRQAARPADAQRAYREALRLRAGFAEALYGLAIAQAAAGERDAANATAIELGRVNAELAKLLAARLPSAATR